MKFKGLTNKEAEARRLRFGENELPRRRRVSDWALLIEQIKNPLIYVLLFAAGITIVLADFQDTLIIMLAVFINTALGFWQEHKAERSLEALGQFLQPKTTVIRSGKQQKINSRQLVPADLVVIKAGDVISADGELIEAVDLSVNEAVLTGESEAVKKTDRSDKIYMGTTVVSGRGVFRVTRTGTETEMGKIARNLEQQVEEATPLQKQLRRFAHYLAWLVFAAAGFIFLTGLLLGYSFLEMFTTAVAVAVAAIPEGLVVTLTVILAIGMQRLLQRKALVRKLVTAETLGSVTTICVDKTGTLTEGRLTVAKADLADEEKALLTAALCSNLSDELEIALWEWVRKKGQDPQQMVDEHRRLNEVPFTEKRKLMAVEVK